MFSFRNLRLALVLGAASLTSGCQYVLLEPSGWVAGQQRDLLIWSTLLMLIIIIPVIAMSLYIPYRYRSTRKAGTAEYDPSFDHSTILEVFIWGVPVLIILALGWLTYIYTHSLDPYKPLTQVEGKPFKVEAVAMDWKWLFIYPELNIASVNELAIPANRPIEFDISATSMMNAFSIPALGGMIYAMPAMETKLHLVADHTGEFYGRSANYSGPGYSDMHFQTYAMNEADFAAWADKVRAKGEELSRDRYIELDKPSIAAPVSYYNAVMPNLFSRIVGLCVAEGKVCVDQMMMQDMNGGGGLKGTDTKKLYEYDNNRTQDGHGNLIATGDKASEPERISMLNQLLATDLCSFTPKDVALNAAAAPVSTQ
ncbi:ubiquinol oxidase subunit II [Rhizobium halophytocola]|uniref:Ubiquinol oxidase polypeptide II n=1 Tax=Rhizobium halophytocola TaxID=735519 RepID=A0ABS4DWW6_9HYPH|nr:ubiquinol oxidase subunit II [Rhizobium halophytocola]MBP1850187.1 cytochrome o ubiquinol oxidase subunit 2 [Rhizobium halophytocola]